MNKYDGGTWEDLVVETMGEDELKRIRKRVKLISFFVTIRNKLNISQKELSEMSGVKQPMIARIESGKVNVGVSTLNKLLKPLGYKLAIIKDDEE